MLPAFAILEKIKVAALVLSVTLYTFSSEKLAELDCFQRRTSYFQENIQENSTHGPDKKAMNIYDVSEFSKYLRNF